MSNRRRKGRPVFAAGAITRADEAAPTDKTKRASEIENAIKKADDDKEATERARDEKLDKLMDSLGSLATMCDGLAKRMDAMEAGDPEDVAADTKRADSDVATRLAAVEAGMPRNRTDAEATIIADAWMTTNQIMTALGETASTALLGETEAAYRRRLLLPLQPHSERWKDVELAELPPKAFGVAEAAIRADAMAAAMNPASIPGDGLREIRRTLPSGHTETTWVGSPRGWMGDLAGPVRQFVTAMNVPNMNAK